MHYNVLFNCIYCGEYEPDDESFYAIIKASNNAEIIDEYNEVVITNEEANYYVIFNDPVGCINCIATVEGAYKYKPMILIHRKYEKINQ